MPDKRSHRGPHPQDEKQFSPAAVADLRSAIADFSLLLTKGYAEKSALKLVGDRLSLTERQRLAVMRNACSDQQLASRKQREVKIADLAGRPIAIDGYNVLITIEAAISDACVFKGRDGCLRDLASIHGTYRKVTETIPAVQMIGEFLKEAGVVECLWLLDSPVSNSGRLKTLIRELAEKNGWKWEIKLSISPDAELSKTDLTVVSSDSVILDRCKSWVNLAGAIIMQKLPSATVIDLCPGRSSAKKERNSQAALVCGEAFQRLAKKFIPRIGAIKEKSSQVMSNELGNLVACATNIGFAIELYLKALLIQLDLSVPHVHDLRILYDAIPQPVRAIIEDVYNTKWPELYGRRVSVTLAKGPKYPLEKPRWDDYKVSLALPDVLARSGDLFQSWRYIFEFTQPKDSPYQFHQFEYGLLWCAAEAIRVEITVRLRETREAPPPSPPAGES